MASVIGFKLPQGNNRMVLRSIASMDNVNMIGRTDKKSEPVGMFDKERSLKAIENSKTQSNKLNFGSLQRKNSYGLKPKIKW